MKYQQNLLIETGREATIDKNKNMACDGLTFFKQMFVAYGSLLSLFSLHVLKPLCILTHTHRDNFILYRRISCECAIVTHRPGTESIQHAIRSLNCPIEKFFKGLLVY